MNAIEAMSEITERSRELVISTGKAEEGGVLVAVSDSGPGLPQANPERLFEAFYTTKSQRHGHGLVDLPLDRPKPWRKAMGNAEPTSRRGSFPSCCRSGTNRSRSPSHLKPEVMRE